MFFFFLFFLFFFNEQAKRIKIINLLFDNVYMDKNYSHRFGNWH